MKVTEEVKYTTENKQIIILIVYLKKMVEWVINSNYSPLLLGESQI